MRGSEIVVIKTPAEEDWQGDPTGPGAERELVGCQKWPRTSTEDDDRGRVGIDGWNVFVPPQDGDRVSLTETIVIEGDDYAVVGTPQRFDRNGSEKGTIIVASKSGR